MQFAFLEKLAQEGHISAKDKAAIYQDCSAILTKFADTPFPTAQGVNAIKRLAVLGENALMNLLVGAAVALPAYAAARKIDQVLFAAGRDRKEVAAIMKIRQDIANSPAFVSHKDKALARFDEIITIAPRLGTMPALMERLVKEHLHSGFTKDDVHKLALLQASYSKSTGETEDMKRKMQSFAKISSALPPHVVGTIYADVLKIVDASGITKEADAKARAASFIAKGVVKPSGWERAWEVAKHLLQTGAIVSGVGAVTGIGAGAVNAVMSTLNKKKLEDQLHKSFAEAMRRSDPNKEPLHANKDKARQAFETLTHFAPNVAAEPEAARAFMNSLVSMDQGAHSGTIKDLADIESKMRGAKGSNPFFEGLAAGSSAMGMQGSISKATSTMLDPFIQQSQAEIRHQVGY